MKSATATTPRVIFLVGIPGAGKTYFAEKFSETFGAPFIETDQARRILADQPSYSSEEDMVVSELGAMQLTELMKTKKTIIYEGGTEARTDRQALVKLVRKHGYEPIIIWVQTDSATAKRRAVRGVRGHTKASLIPVDRFEYLHARFTPPNEAEKAVVISGKHTVVSQTKVVLKQLLPPAPATPPPTPLTPPPASQTKPRPQTVRRPPKLI